MTDEYKMTWHRKPETGHWEALDLRERPFPVYVASQDKTARPGSQWTLTVAVPGRPGTQTRTGFDTLATAKVVALNTRCHLCGRHLPFATMKESGTGWRCRDYAECATASQIRDEEARRIHREIRDTPWADVSIRDAEDGPELIFRTDAHNQTIVQATEPDLIRLTYVLLTRFRVRYARELEEIAKAVAGEPQA